MSAWERRRNCTSEVVVKEDFLSKGFYNFPKKTCQLFAKKCKILTLPHCDPISRGRRQRRGHRRLPRPLIGLAIHDFSPLFSRQEEESERKSINLWCNKIAKFGSLPWAGVRKLRRYRILKFTLFYVTPVLLALRKANKFGARQWKNERIHLRRVLFKAQENSRIKEYGEQTSVSFREE